jgi:hypothetical protein
LSSASVFSGVCDTDCTELPPNFSPLKACFREEKSTSSSLDEESSKGLGFYWFSSRKFCSGTSPPRKSGRREGSAYSRREERSSPSSTTFSRVYLARRGVSLAQMVSKSMGVFTKTNLSGLGVTYEGALGSISANWR